MVTVIKAYSKRLASVKPDDQYTDLTLAHRRYAYNQRLYYERHVGMPCAKKAKEKYDK